MTVRPRNTSSRSATRSPIRKTCSSRCNTGKAPLKLAGHFWFNADALKAGKKCPTIVEFNPYRRRDGTMILDAKM